MTSPRLKAREKFMGNVKVTVKVGLGDSGTVDSIQQCSFVMGGGGEEIFSVTCSAIGSCV